jgi:protein phosphatase
MAHVGDSRVLWRDGHLRQLTQDHSWVGEQVRAGALTDADARRHPWRNAHARDRGRTDPDVDVRRSI